MGEVENADRYRDEYKSTDNLDFGIVEVFACFHKAVVPLISLTTSSTRPRVDGHLPFQFGGLLVLHFPGIF
jgi:hypothetical protein